MSDEPGYIAQLALNKAQERLQSRLHLDRPVSTARVAVGNEIKVKISMKPSPSPAHLELEHDEQGNPFWVIYIQPAQAERVRQRAIGHEIGEYFGRILRLVCVNIERYCDLVGDCIRCPDEALASRSGRLEWEVTDLAREFTIPPTDMFIRLAYYRKQPAAVVRGSYVRRIGDWSSDSEDWLHHALRGRTHARRYRLADGGVGVLPPAQLIEYL